jgi:hypothetical protein
MKTIYDPSGLKTRDVLHFLVTDGGGNLHEIPVTDIKVI